ncbi:MAG: methylmalonyl Co-A mutase-associated GTPase MeaB, partial [Myxococcales bacterium]|nr:methylmalonyl Co-A mutase-associated GTPase MeaB [Myxococcales bacterium]
MTAPFRSIPELIGGVRAKSPRALGRAITLVEEGGPAASALLSMLDRESACVGSDAATIGLTGTGGAGKSTLAGRLIDLLRARGRRVGLVAVDPSSPISGGAILGDRVRMMRHACDPDVLIRSMASRGRLGGLSAATAATARLMKLAGCDPVFIETVGVGQAEFDIVRLADVTALVLAPGLG